MSFFDAQLRELVVTNFMSMSVSHEPVKTPNSLIDDPVKEDPVKEDPIKEDPVKEEFTYLSDDPLAREFGFNRDISKPYTLKLCIYRLNQVLPYPFLEFYMIKGSGEYDFPHKQLPVELFKDLDRVEEDRIEPMDGPAVKEEDGIEDIFMDQCTDLFRETVNTTPLEGESYKGFMEKDDTIVAVFDDTQNVSGTWVTMHEIVNKKTVFNIDISPFIVELLSQSRVLSNIKNSKNENLPLPHVLYLCKKDKNGLLQNVYYEQDQTSQTHATLINERVKHPVLRDVYMFSETILPSEYDVIKIKRFALYIDPFKKIMIKGQNPQQLTVENIPQESVIGFQEDGIDYWCTKSPIYFVEL